MTDWNQFIQPPFNQHLGIKIDKWEENRVEISAELQPEFCNSQGIPHGGFICTLIDSAAGLSGIYCPNPDRKRRALTLSLNTNFTGQASSNTLRAVGTVTSAGRKIFHTAVNVYDGNDTLVATGTGVFRYRTGSETVEGSPREPDEAIGE